MDENSDSALTEELPRCSAPEISRRLEEKIEDLKNPENSKKHLTVVINIKDGRILSKNRNCTGEIISSRHPYLFEYFSNKRIKHIFLEGSGQIIAELDYNQFLELKNINHGEVQSLDYSNFSLDIYKGIC
jgi:hypothetical protein